MKKHQLDIVLLQETHINYTGKEIHEDFTFYFSSVIEDEHRKSVDSKLEDLAQRVKRKTITEEEAKRERMDWKSLTLALKNWELALCLTI